ncbi:cell division protein ZapE [Qingshengfaniella alkalisoli]|uniref:AFG1 family ATPase n=1 Tax=Qingshengfaniella alkalisoli TaxID=2599296 RepID=A0A5B8J667_9RHOB|nr:cell division protein ZapE [Qingshengfaniella alkalisoli]QDY69927.1 AFG1 family ATPase [Qingshengfaniella alkalisoli]
MATVQNLYSTRVKDGDIARDDAQKAVLPELDRIADAASAPPPRKKWFAFGKQPEPPKGLYLWGGVGRGKSMLMDLLVEAADAPKRRVHFHAFMQEIHAGMNAARAKGVDDALAPVADAVAREVRLLAFDEMQITDITDAMIVGRLFERLFEAGVLIVTTSNRPPDDLYKDGLNRQLFMPFITLIKDRLVVRELTSPTDYRQDRLNGEQVYFTPADAKAKAGMDALWSQMTGRSNAEQLTPLVLKVKGRDVELPDFANGVGRASFWDLCGSALGPADYLSIAEAVDALFLESIPCLGASNFNQAKRFVTLIDALYEAKVRLVASAADEPENLYIEGTGSFEFERTASRLREMQDADWGKE